jgi:hypothetical protein
MQLAAVERELMELDLLRHGKPFKRRILLKKH